MYNLDVFCGQMFSIMYISLFMGKEISEARVL